MTKSLEDRWTAKVNICDEKDLETSCWLWCGGKTKQGYGQIYCNQKILLAHRVGWELAGNEAPPKDLALRNLCGNKSCVNPTHWKLIPKIDCAVNLVKFTRQQKIEDFVNQIDEHGPLILDTPCWTWVGPRKENGYGQFSSRYFSSYAHRASWEIFNGNIPDNLHVCHHCDNPSCVNPDHLFLGTHQDNMRDMVQKGRKRKTKIKKNIENKRPYVRVSDEQVRSIRQDFRPLSEIAKEYGVDQATISLIRHRKRRAGVAD